jgi:hypothetical protein
MKPQLFLQKTLTQSQYDEWTSHIPAKYFNKMYATNPNGQRIVLIEFEVIEYWKHLMFGNDGSNSVKIHIIGEWHSIVKFDILTYPDKPEKYGIQTQLMSPLGAYSNYSHHYQDQMEFRNIRFLIGNLTIELDKWRMVIS